MPLVLQLQIVLAIQFREKLARLAVNCRTTIINKKIFTKGYQEDIKNTCDKYIYQPFDKNGAGRKGYLFDLND